VPTVRLYNLNIYIYIYIYLYHPISIVVTLWQIKAISYLISTVEYIRKSNMCTDLRMKVLFLWNIVIIIGLYNVSAHANISVSFPEFYSCILSYLLQKKLWFFFLYGSYRIVILMETLRVLYEVRTGSVNVGVPFSVFKYYYVGYNAHCAYRNLWPGDYMWIFYVNTQT